MAKELPVIAAGVDCTVDALLSSGDVEIEGWVWPQSARRQEAAGKLRAITDSDGDVVCWQRVIQPEMLREEPSTDDRSKPMPVLDRSSCSISPSEMNAYAGRHFKGGASQTKGLTEFQRAQRKFSSRPLTEAEILAGKRQRFGLPPVEDFIERLEVKVECFGIGRYADA